MSDSPAKLAATERTPRPPPRRNPPPRISPARPLPRDPPIPNRPHARTPALAPRIPLVPNCPHARMPAPAPRNLSSSEPPARSGNNPFKVVVIVVKMLVVAQRLLPHAHSLPSRAHMTLNPNSIAAYTLPATAMNPPTAPPPEQQPIQRRAVYGWIR